MKRNISIAVENVTKVYKIHHEKPTFVENLLNGLRYESFTALKEVDFSVNRGEMVGIIGSNGSGKTTLLKIIAGITVPTKGKVLISGHLVSLIDLEAGFHPELSGMENLYLNAMLLGMTKKEIEEMKSDILKFAELGDFIDAPLYTYSSGMKLRLGFSIAIHTKPEILVLDENLAVGDRWFQDKVDQKVKELVKSRDKTFIWVSHNLYEIRRRCERVIWLEKGKIVADGPTKKILARYRRQYLSK